MLNYRLYERYIMTAEVFVSHGFLNLANNLL